MENLKEPVILLVDDFVENLILLERIIRPLPVEIIKASSGQEALNKTEGRTLFLALIDVKMPGMDGIELAGHLRKSKHANVVPVIFITAFADNEILEKCYQVGAVDFISKPFQPNILLSKAKIFLELFRQKEQLRENQIKLEEASKELKYSNQSLKRSYAKLTELSRHLEEVREDERKRIALDLHDDLGQKLTALIMDLAWLKTKLMKNKPQIIEKVMAMKRLLEETIHTIRKIAAGLRPGILDDLGLSEALKLHLKEFTKNSGIRSEYHFDTEDVNFDPKTSIVIFRVVQEALTNVVRHAQAATVSLIIETTQNGVHFEINDDGIGITKENLKKSQTFGVLGMKERVTSLGGTLQISGKPALGTTLSVDLPALPTGGN